MIEHNVKAYHIDEHRGVHARALAERIAAITDAEWQDTTVVLICSVVLWQVVKYPTGLCRGCIISKAFAFMVLCLSSPSMRQIMHTKTADIFVQSF